MNTVAIVGELTFDCQQMMRETMSMRSETLEKIKNECPSVDPNTIDWSSVNRNTWFACVSFEKNKGYYFPIAESENRDDNYSRVKSGMAYFISQGFTAYKLQ